MKPFQINFVKTLHFAALKAWVTTQSMACTVFCYVENGTMGFNSTQVTDVHLHFPVFKLSCVNRTPSDWPNSLRRQISNYMIGKLQKEYACGFADL